MIMDIKTALKFAESLKAACSIAEINGARDIIIEKHDDMLHILVPKFPERIRVIHYAVKPEAFGPVEPKPHICKTCMYVACNDCDRQSNHLREMQNGHLSACPDWKDDGL